MRTAAIFVVLLLALLPGPAVADGDFTRPGPYLGVAGTWAAHWYPGDFDIDVGARTITDNSFGLVVRGGWRLRDWLAVEAGYEWLDGFDQNVAGSRAFTLTSHVLTGSAKLLYPGWGRFQPYALAGIGVSIYDVNDRAGIGAGLEGTSAGFVGQFLLGLDVYLNRSWVATLEGGGVFPTTRVDGGAGGELRNLFYIPIRAGLQYRF